ncbi:hypothetical protein [Okeania sp. SIO2B3]|uniref:hypothetical protein n=1 Tax=Okeania sp. SIO2B3 TaxID=2607784 RepID=UPI0013C29509|nr:hypothetical protein [Okeania sp. SIO2B3]NET43979.1 hypothetical protein [Okeania sp. SIO2B3]
MLDFIHQPDSEVRLGNYLQFQLQQRQWTQFRAAVAFVKYSGVRHISKLLNEFSYNAFVKISVGIDHDGTSMEGLSELLNSVENRGEIWVYHNDNNYSTFHPKLYLFKNDIEANILVGSGNLTEGGLFTNYEASFCVLLNLKIDVNLILLRKIEAILDLWSDREQDTAQLLTSELLNQLVRNKYVKGEAQVRATQELASSRNRTSLFANIQVPRAPVPPRQTPDEPEDLSEEDFEVEIPEPVAAPGGNFTGFAMTLQRTDVGRGQTTAGTSARSPEIFIPLSARDYDPEFWGWPGDFTPDPKKPRKMDRRNVKMRVGITTVDVNMMTWPDKHDFRLRSEALRSAGNVGDILRVERTDGQSGFAYYVEIIPQGTLQYSQFLALCVNSVRNSKKRWGYY